MPDRHQLAKRLMRLEQRQSTADAFTSVESFVAADGHPMQRLTYHQGGTTFASLEVPESCDTIEAWTARYGAAD